MYEQGKWDLFFVPFFSWLLISMESYPLDRKDRSQAVKAINLATVTAVKHQAGDTISISPEGTRSKSGLLLKFKKGPFHLWEDAKLPIIPAVLFGAFELCPPGTLAITPGKVYIRFLDPITVDRAKSREEMMKIVRRLMLDAQRTCPRDAGAPPSAQAEVDTWMSITMALIINYLSYRNLYWIFFDLLKLKTMMQAVIVFLALAMIITVACYVRIRSRILAFNESLVDSLAAINNISTN
jgi:1-acyl-sn-glycerol-3-phosphate acyltransferase